MHGQRTAVQVELGHGNHTRHRACRLPGRQPGCPCTRMHRPSRFPPGVPDDEKKREIDVIASLIDPGTMPSSSSYRHHPTSRRFGPVEYHAATIPANENKEQWK